MANRWVKDDQITKILYDLPSDFEESTDEEDENIIELDDDTCQILPVETIGDGTNQEAAQMTIVVDAEQLGNQCTSSYNIDENRNIINRKWKKKPEPSVDIEFSSSQPEIFTNAANPLEAFLEFFDDILDKIVYESNLKSVQHNKPAAITKDELLVFFGINIIMSFHSLPSIAHYWSTHDVFRVEPITRAMGRERFQTILRWLHVNDNSQVDANRGDKLYKIRPLLDHLNVKFLQNRQMKEHLSVDESTILFKGRSSLKQYNPMKPIKRGYKLWCLCDDSGYVYKTNVYTGKTEAADNVELRKEVGLGGDVVLNLLSCAKGKNHKVFMDNYFSSFPLMEALKFKKILACGTIRSNRKDFPKTLIEDKKLKRGEFDYRSTPDGITVYKWKDSKAVHLVSNYHGVSLTSVERKEKDGSKSTIPCPQVVYDYNRHMGGVDLHDMLRQQYGIDRKSTKWWHRLFFGLFDMAIVNSFIMYYEHNPHEKKPIADFRADVGLGLLTFADDRYSRSSANRRRSNYSTPESVRLSNVGIHKVIFTSTRGRCPVCSKNGLQSRPVSKCSHCGIFLCCNATKNCFNLYHS